MTEPRANLDKSSDAGRMGKAAKYLVSAVCIPATRGRRNGSTSIVDDEGVDLVFHLRDSTATLAVQVKASTKEDRKDQWSSYRLTAAELPVRIVERLEGLA